MRRSVLIILTVLSLCSIKANAQVDEETQKELKAAKAKISELEKQQNTLEKSLNNLKQDNEAIEKKLGKLQKSGNDSRNASIEYKKAIILGSADYAGKALTTLNGFNSASINGELMSRISDLNNPTNSELGFSLELVIKREVELLLKDKVSKEDGNKINSFVGTLLNNPITEILKTSVPVINNVVNFISTISFNNKKISQEDLKKFISSLSGYFEYYESLSKNNLEFASSFNEINVKIAALDMLLKNYVGERITILTGVKYEAEGKKWNLNVMCKNEFSEYSVNNLVKTLTLNRDLGEVNEDEKLIFPTTTSSQAQYFYGEFESLASQFVNAYKKYVTAIIKSMELGRSLSKDPSERSIIDQKITEKQEKFKTLLGDWEEVFLNNISLFNLKKSAEDLAINK